MKEHWGWWLIAAGLATAFVALLIAVARLGAARGSSSKVERFEEEDGDDNKSSQRWIDEPRGAGTQRLTPGTVELSADAKLIADPSRCTLAPSGYSFDAEGLIAHPRSSPTDPKCLLVRSGMGLLASDDPLKCTPVKDQLWNRWQNPLNQAGKGGAIVKLYPDHVAGLDRCTVSFDPTASSEDLATIDRAMSVAGAEIRSGLPRVQRQLEITTQSLHDTTVSLSAATVRLNLDSSRMTADATALTNAQSQIQQSQDTLEALASNSEQSMRQSVTQFQQQYSDMLSQSQQQLSSRIARDRDQLASAVATQKAACDAELTPLRNQLSSLKSAAAAAATPAAPVSRTQAGNAQPPPPPPPPKISYTASDFVQMTMPGTDLPGQPMRGTRNDCETACDNASCVGFSRMKSVGDGEISDCYLKQKITADVNRGDPSWQTFLPG